MKKIFLILSSFFCIFALAQENRLQSLFKVEVFIDKLSIGYETPINDRLLLDVSAGVGGANVVGNDKVEYKLGKDNGYNYFGQFAKAQVRYYLNRDKRAEKGKSLINNAGSFIAFQSKFNLNGSKDYIGEALLNDITFGQILPLGKKITFKYNIGAGYGYNLKYSQGSIYPAVNLSFGYVIL